MSGGASFSNNFEMDIEKHFKFFTQGRLDWSTFEKMNKIYNAALLYGSSFESDIAQYKNQLESDFNKLKIDTASQLSTAEYESEKMQQEAGRDIVLLKDEYSRHFDIMTMQAYTLARQMS